MEGYTPNKSQGSGNSAKESLLEVLRATGPVHGSGMEALAHEERANIEALLSRAGSSLDDPLIELLPAETLKDLTEYGRMKVSDPNRPAVVESILSAYQDTKSLYYKEAA